MKTRDHNWHFRPDVRLLPFIDRYSGWEGELLPQPVSNLARKLDEALGPGNDEGTLQPTAWIRLGVQHLMANAALRPWALSEADAYHTSREVDSGLVGWAKGNHARSRLYDEIRKAYPAAEKSLAANYATAYGVQCQKSEEWPSGSWT